jgi:hypothetical protein
MPPVKKQLKRAKPSDVAPRGAWIPHIYKHELPTAAESADLLRAVSYGLGIEAASAYAGVPSEYVRNWISRGREEEMNPYDESVHKEKIPREVHTKHWKTVVVPCYNLWMAWRKARSEFLMSCVGRLRKSKDWHAHAWLLERLDPGTYVKASAPTALRRDLLPYEKEVEAAVIDDPDDDQLKEVVQIILPGNGR